MLFTWVNCSFCLGVKTELILTLSFDLPENSAPPSPVVDCCCRPYIQSQSMGVMTSRTVHRTKQLDHGGDAGVTGTGLAFEV